MNTVTRMVLVPEEQHLRTHKRQTDYSPIINSTLPADIKVRLMNQLLMKDATRKEAKKKKVERKFKEKVEKRFQLLKALEEAQLLKPKDDMKLPVYPHNHHRQNLNDEDEDEEDDDDDDDDNKTVVGSDSDESYHSTIDAMQKQKEEKEHVIKVNPSNINLPGTSMHRDEEKMQRRPMDLLLTLKSDHHLVAEDNKVKDEGVKVKGSDIEKVVNYLLDKKWKGKAPFGTAAVIKYIKENDLHVKHLIKNPSALERLQNQDISWLTASNISKENITRRKA